jgi:hypothetical protein
MRRTLRNFKYLMLSALLFMSCGDRKENSKSVESSGKDNVPGLMSGLTEKEKSEGWEYLFDGKNTGKWKGVGTDNFPSEAWAIEEGALVLSGKAHGSLITREVFDKFELALEFKLTDSANSGIKYFVGEMNDKDKAGKKIFNGPEYQIIDDFNHPEITDDEKGRLTSTGALYLLYSPENKTLKPAGEWNTAKIVAKGEAVEHWLNGVKLLSYERGSEEFRNKVMNTKFKNQEDYGEITRGHIMLTDHHDKVYFRNIKVRRL